MQQGTLRLPPEEVGKAKFSVTHPLQHIPGAILAGGSLRDMIRGYTPKDYDYYFKSGRDFAAGRDYLLKHGGKIVRAGLSSLRIERNGRTYELLSGHWYPSPESLISKFDFTACQVCAVGEEVIAMEGALADIESGTLRLAYLVDLPRTLKRAERFVKDYGFTDAYNVIPELQGVVGETKTAAPIGPQMGAFKPVIDGWRYDKSSLDTSMADVRRYRPPAPPEPLVNTPGGPDDINNFPQETKVLMDHFLNQGVEPMVEEDISPEIPPGLEPWDELWVDYVGPTGLRAEATQMGTSIPIRGPRPNQQERMLNDILGPPEGPVPGQYVDIGEGDSTSVDIQHGPWEAYITDGDSSDVNIWLALPGSYPDYESAIRAGIAAWRPIIQNIINSPDPATWGVNNVHEENGWDFPPDYAADANELRQYLIQQHSPMLRNGQVNDFIEKVRHEVEGMRDSGLSDIDVKLAVKQKYGDMVFNAVFE